MSFYTDDWLPDLPVDPFFPSFDGVHISDEKLPITTLISRIHLDLGWKQKYIICLACRGLGIQSRPSEISLEMLASRLTPLVLYILLNLVGCRIVELGASFRSPPTQSDLFLLYYQNPDFHISLTVANIVARMNGKECEQLNIFISSINHHSNFSIEATYETTCEILICEFEGGKFDMNIFSDWLGQSKCFKYKKYVGEYFERRNMALAEGEKEGVAQKALERGMEEGFVYLNNVKLVICGPPCVGKTAFKALLLNNPAPLQHNSTLITARPVKAIERIAAGRKVWAKISEEDLLHILSDIIRSIDEVTHPDNSPHPQPSSNTGPEPVALTQPLPKPQIESPSPVHVSEPASIDQLSRPQSDPSREHQLAVAASSPTSFEQTRDVISKKLIEKLASPKETKGSLKLCEDMWIHLLDSGGQPQFADLLRMFVRGNSLYILVMKVTESLHEKPIFVYSIDGEPLNAPKEMTMTNLQIIESFVHSVAATSRDPFGGKSQPAIAIVATHCDQQSWFRRLLGWEEKLTEKNEKLLSCLGEFRDLFVFYNCDSNELIFPVDNLCERNREKISADIRHRLLSTRSDISFSVEVPVRWYAFDLNMKEEASKESHGMISLQSCYTIGSKLGMDNKEVGQCLIYLDSMRLCIYYPNLLPHVVFTNPQFLIDSLSIIVRVSFVDDLKQILPRGVRLSDQTVQSLKRDGVFNELLLSTLELTFIPHLFSKSNLLLLLQHFLVISTIKAPHISPTQYFIPILLPAERLTKEQKTVFSQKIDPLLITFNRSIVLQGFFPTLVVSLLSRQKKPLFFIDSRSDNFPRQLRHAVNLYSEDLFGSVFLCEEYKSIEVYFTGHPQHCYHLRKVILEGLSASAEILEYDQEKLEISALVHCTQKCHTVPANNDKPHSITFSDQQNFPLVGCGVEALPVFKLDLTDERRSCWLIDSFCSSSPICYNDVVPEKTILNQSHAPVILKALRKLVDEWELLGIYLGIENHKLKEIKNGGQNQATVCRKDMICHWLETGTATRENLISALVDLQRNDIAANIRRLPTV